MHRISIEAADSTALTVGAVVNATNSAL